jgi:hypothetical protein
MTLVAHAGHWIVQLLYLMPVAAMVGAILWGKYRGRHHTREEPDAPPRAFTERSDRSD